MYRLLPIFSGLILLIPSPATAQTPKHKSMESRLFAYLDRDKDGTLREAEFEKIPLPMKTWLIERQIDASQPLSRDLFLKSAPEMMQAIRKGRHAGREKAPVRKVTLKIQQQPSTRISSPVSATSSTSSGSSDSPNPTLSASFSAGDLDKDGQIGLYEWRKWRKSAFAEFLKLDHNSDGFLTPRELLNAPTPSAVPVATTTTPSPASTTTSTTTPTPASTSSNTPTAAPASYDPNHPDAKTPLKYFDYMDVNKNGTIDGPAEWLKGKVLRPIVERSGADLTKPMTKDQLVVAYIKGKAASQ